MSPKALPKKPRFSTTTRGKGKVFTLLRTNASAERWTAASTTKQGARVPAKVHVKKDGQCVLVVPALDVDQTVEIAAFDASGTQTIRATHRVSAKGAKLQSQINTALHNPRIDSVRNCDSVAVPGRLTVTPVRMIPHDNINDLLHLNVFFSTYKRNGEPEPIEVQVLDQQGNNLALEKPVLLGDLIEEYDKYPGVFYRLACFSVPVPMNTPWICVAASCPQSGFDANFVCIQPHDREYFFTNWIRNLYGFDGTDPNYEVWFKDQAATKSELALQREVQEDFATRPLFSIVVPLYHTPIDLFNEMSASVLAQSYPNFELILVNSTPQDAELGAAVNNLARADERIRVVDLEKNLGISGNTQAGVDVAKGDFICFFDHDDLLEPDLLYWYVDAINEYPTTDLLYCNEDKLIDGHYVWPSYKPDWSPLLLETNNYVCHMLCIRASVLKQIPWPGNEFDGAQDHHLTLAAGELARNVYHVPKVLYHWRALEGSTAADATAKPESNEAGRLAVSEHFRRLGINAQVNLIPDLPHRFATTYLLDSRPSITAVVSKGTGENVQKTVRSLEALGWDELEIITCGVDETPSDVSAAMADGASKAKNDYLLLLTAGITVDNVADFEQLVAVTMRDDVCIAAPRIAFPDHSTCSNGLALFNYNTFVLDQYHCRDKDLLTILPHELIITTSDCLIMSRSDYRRIGGIVREAPAALWGTLLCLAARQQHLKVLQFSSASVTRLFTARDLSLNIEYRALADATDRAYLLSQYPEDFRLFDHFYKPQF